MLSQEHSYCIAIEKLINCKIPERAKYIRVIFAEITRILNHLLAVGCHAMDVGAMTPMLWAFEGAGYHKYLFFNKFQVQNEDMLSIILEFKTVQIICNRKNVNLKQNECEPSGWPAIQLNLMN